MACAPFTTQLLLVTVPRVACVLQSCVVMDLEFSPNCMTYRHGFLAAGGICSEVGSLGSGASHWRRSAVQCTRGQHQYVPKQRGGGVLSCSNTGTVVISGLTELPVVYSCPRYESSLTASHVAAGQMAPTRF